MAKFCGAIGFALTQEAAAGVWEETLAEVEYTGDILRNNVRREQGDTVNDNLLLNNVISIVADSFAISNLGYMRYVKWMGTNWKITNVEIHRPRLLLTLGGVYNV